MPGWVGTRGSRVRACEWARSSPGRAGRPSLPRVAGHNAFLKRIQYPATDTLDSLAPPGSMTPYLQPTMGKQYNKEIKKKRRLAYLKRRKAATKKAAKK